MKCPVPLRQTIKNITEGDTMTVKEYAKENGFVYLTKGDLDKEIKGCYISDLLSLAMSRVEEGQVWMTVQGNVNIAAVAALTEPACILLVEGQKASEDTLARAKENEITILQTGRSAYEAACLLYEQMK